MFFTESILPIICFTAVISQLSFLFSQLSFFIFFNVLQAPEWTEEDLSQLTRSMVKFPGGTPGRWEKIAHELGRSVTDVSSLRFTLYRERQTRTSQLCRRQTWMGSTVFLGRGTILLGPESEPLMK